MKLINKFAIAFMCGIMISACISTENNDVVKEEKDYYNYNGINDSLMDENDAVVYTIPSPLQVASLFKIMDLKYNDNLLNQSASSDLFFTTSQEKAINLGMLCVDFGYTSIYQQHQTSLIYLERVKKLMEELNIENKKGQMAAERFKSNLNNKDSLYSIMLDMQNDIQIFMKETEKNELSLLIVSGMYIESLYFAAKLYDKQLVNVVMNQENNTMMNYMMLQHKIFLDNIIEMHIKIDGEKNLKLKNHFSSLQKEFDKLNITYTYDEEAKKITDVNFDKQKMNGVRKLIVKVRESLQKS